MTEPAPMADAGDGMVPAVNPQGELVSIPQADFARALKQGFQQPTPEQVEAYNRPTRYGGAGQTLAAAGEGALSGLTFGQGPRIEHALGVPLEDIAARKEVHPIAHGAGELGAIVGATALTGGAAGAGETVGALGTARAAAQYTAPSLIARVGQAARVLGEGSAVPGLLGRALPAVAQGVAEGGLYSAADVAERQALHDPGLTAESAAAEVGFGALLGGGVMGVGHAAGEGFNSLVEKSGNVLRGAAKRVASGESKDSINLVLSAEARPAVTALDQAAPGAADSLAVARPETAQFLLDHVDQVKGLETANPGMLKDVLSKATPEEAAFILDNQEGIIQGTMQRNQVGQALTDQVTGTYQATEGAVRDAWRGARSAEMEALAAKADPAAAAKQAAGIFDDLASKTEELQRAPELYTPGSGTRLQRLGEGLQRDATAAPEETYLRLNRLKQSLDDLIPWGAESTTAAGRDTAGLLKDLRGKVKAALEDSDVWGEAGARQKQFNSAFQEYKDAAKRLGAGKSSSIEAKLLRRIDDGAGGVTYEANEKSINTWLNAMADARGGAKSDAFNAYLNKAEVLAKEMGASGYEGAAALQQRIQAMRQSFASIEQRATVNQVVNRLQAPGKIAVSQGYIPNPGGLAQAAAQAAVAGAVPGGHAITGAITGSISRLRSPSMMVGVLGGLDRLAQKTSAAIDGGVGRIFASGATGAAAGAAATKAGGITSETFPHVAASLHQHAGDPDHLATALATHTAGLSAQAPATTTALHGLAARGVQTLAGRLPQPGQRQPLDPPYRPSKQELTAYNRAHEIAEKPTRILDHIANGTVTRDQVQTLMAIYPKLGAHMQARVTERLAGEMAKGAKLPHATRMALSMFLGSDLDHSTTQPHMAAVQASFARPQAPQPGQRVNSAGMAHVRMSSRLATPMQAANNRRGT